jgi:hypothetical protein
MLVSVAVVPLVAWALWIILLQLLGLDTTILVV